jgi:predicted DNA-binding transcriptional regulator AlpA
MFQVSRSTIYRLMKEESWPHVLFGTEVRFTPEDVAAITAMHHKEPAQPRKAPRVGTRAARRNGK